MRARIPRPLERFVLITALLVLASGSAYAAGLIGTDDIKDGAVTTPKLHAGAVSKAKLDANAVNSAKVIDDSLTGNDIQESTLDQVPSALSAAVGGTGRSASLAGCNPTDENLVTCTTVSMTLPAPSRVLLLGRVRAITDDGQTVGFGSCDLGTNFSGPVTGSTVEIATTQNDLEQIPLMAVTSVINPDSVMFGIDCNQENTHGGGIRYDFISLTAVALSDD